LRHLPPSKLVIPVLAAVAEELPKALVANEPTAMAADPNLQKNPDLRLLNLYVVFDLFVGLDT